MRRTFNALLLVLAVLSLGCSGHSSHSAPAPTTRGIFRNLTPSSSTSKASSAARVMRAEDTLATPVLSPTYPPSSLTVVARRTSSTIMMVDGTVLIAGDGGGALEIFDPATELFSTYTGQPGCDLTQSTYSPTMFNLPSGQVAIVGSTQGSRDVEIYDPVSHLVTLQTGVFQVAESYQFASIQVDVNHWLFTGGIFVIPQDGTINICPSQLVDTSTWTSQIVDADNPLLQIIGHQMVKSVAGDIFVIGGVHPGGMGQPGILKWDPVTSTFSQVAALPWGLVNFSLAVLDNNTIGIYGGMEFSAASEVASNPTGYFVHADVNLFNPNTFAITPSTPLLEPRVEQGISYLQNGLTLHLGGTNQNLVASDVQIWHDWVKGTTGATGNMLTARSAYCQAALNNGLVLVIGGADVNGNLLFSSEVYDPKTEVYVQYATDVINTGQTTQFSTDYAAGVTWSVTGQGNIDATGLYTAPATGPALLTSLVYVTATAKDNGTTAVVPIYLIPYPTATK